MLEKYISIILSVVISILAFYYYKKKKQLFQLCVGFYFIGIMFITIFPDYFYYILIILAVLSISIFSYWLYKKKLNK
ncbi:MAG: hypothetical protein K940chlam5_00397 [Candidatus Anoxychlamydiales bacterium]|nr:hypothetical protein [Candidatus Anoxychlamydiales bacterium]